jgi:hypothetical protein
MKAEEIRAMQEGDSHNDRFWLAEIAAQLAEANELKKAERDAQEKQS